MSLLLWESSVGRASIARQWVGQWGGTHLQEGFRPWTVNYEAAMPDCRVI